MVSKMVPFIRNTDSIENISEDAVILVYTSESKSEKGIFNILRESILLDSTGFFFYYFIE